MTTQYVTVPCSKCDGTGRIRAFTHIQNGICFSCAGTGTKRAKVTPPPPITDYQAKLLRIVETGDLSHYTYGQLLTLRDFAHWPLPGHPTLLDTWQARGEGYFQAAQDERWHAQLAEIHAS